jgi:hypothetical protein
VTTNNEAKAQNTFDVVDPGQEKEQDAIRKMEHFILVALNGIITLME